jgi:hypothetical protein
MSDQERETIRRVLEALLAKLDGESDIAKGSAAVQENHQASHPGLERFPLAEARSQSSVPRACFMEPGRTCINSGACEMRGY